MSKSAKTAIGIVLVVIFLIFIYPTPYRYYKLDEHFVVKENWITGKMYRLDPFKGWVEIERFLEAP